MKPFSMRHTVGICAIAALVAGCGSQSQIGSPEAMPQSATLPTQSSQNILKTGPNVACPLAGGKTYKTGNGHVSMKFWPVETTAPSRSSLGVYLTYSDWKQDRPLVHYTTKLLTCGPQGSKKPIGELGTCCGGSSQSSCHNGVCTYTLKLYVDYKIAGNLPGKKAWKFDYVQFVPEKKVAGFGALPSLRIQVNP